MRLSHYSLVQVALSAGGLDSDKVVSRNDNTVSIPADYTYVLPQPFSSNLTQDFIAGTEIRSSSICAILEKAQKAPFVSYSQEFDELLGDGAELVTLVPNDGTHPPAWAGETGAWVPELNQVWFTSTLYGGPSAVYILYLDNNTVVQPDLTAAKGYGNVVPIANPSGGYYFDGYIYLALAGNERDTSSIVAVDVHTWLVTPIVNSFFGLQFPVIDDIAITYSNTSEGIHTHIYFSTLDLAAFGLSVGRSPAVLPNAFWMVTPETKTIQPVIPRADIMTPNGVAVDRKFKHLYVTDTSATEVFGGGAKWNNTGSPAIYRYDISPEDGFLSNKVLFGFTREGVSDGIKVDDKGRVWTAEYEGIMVRNRFGKVIGFFNKEVIFGRKEAEIPLTNFALAGDRLIIQAVDSIQMVKFAEMLIDPNRFRYPPK